MDKIEKIRQEIERQMKFYDEKEMKAWDDSEQGDEDALWYQGHRKMCAKLLTFLNTLTEELDKSLEEAEFEYAQSFNEMPANQEEEKMIYDAFKAGAEWQYQKDRREFAKIRAKIWCEGFDAHKEQMLKDAIEGRVFMSFAPGHDQMVMADVDLPVNTKVRVIVLKAEEE